MHVHTTPLAPLRRAPSFPIRNSIRLCEISICILQLAAAFATVRADQLESQRTHRISIRFFVSPINFPRGRTPCLRQATVSRVVHFMDKPERFVAA